MNSGVNKALASTISKSMAYAFLDGKRERGCAPSRLVKGKPTFRLNSTPNTREGKGQADG